MSEHAEVLNALPSLTPEDMDGPKPLTKHEQRRIEKLKKAEIIVDDDSLDLPAKIDAMAQVHGWFSADTTLIDAYMTDETDLHSTVEKMAAPIDETYSTADHGRMYFESERTARYQRQFHSAEKALEMWGAEQDFPEPDEKTKSLRSTEGRLWALWYGFLHASKRIPWTDEARHEKLLSLVKALKARPDPPLPRNMTIPMKQEWIWESGKLWSELILLGPSARESWNDGCGCGSGWTIVDQHAWANVNGFVARLTASGTADFQLYGLWALRDALEQVIHGDSRGLHMAAPVLTQLSTHLTVAAVWVLIAGEYMYERRERDGKGIDGENVDLGLREKKLPWYSDGKLTEPRWTWYRRRFEQQSHKEELSMEVRDLASRAARKISSFKD